MAGYDRVVVALWKETAQNREEVKGERAGNRQILKKKILKVLFICF
jgi:hypothetical protein